MADLMNTSTVEQALRRLGKVTAYHRDIEMLLVGGAAAMVTGLLAPTRVTTDCDVMVYIPPDAMSVVELAAGTVAQEMKLALGWLNSDVQLRREALPDGWAQRKVPVGTYGRLRVYAASRPDLIAMKVLAGRDQDIEDLQAMRLREDDVKFVCEYLDSLSNKGTSNEQIEAARSLLESLEVYEHE